MLLRISVLFFFACIPFATLLPVVQASAPAIRSDMVLVHTNVERYLQGLPLLRTNALLSAVAEQKMRDLFTRQYFAHEAPTGEDVSDLADGVGYAYLAVGENLAMGDFVSSKDVVRAWMESPGHRANILSPTYTELGIAGGKSVYKGRTIWMVVQSFGLPKSACPAVDSELRADLEKVRSKLELLERILPIREARLQVGKESRATYLANLESYNATVLLYNDLVAEHRKKVETFNAKVEAFNACLAKRTSSTS